MLSVAQVYFQGVNFGASSLTSDDTDQEAGRTEVPATISESQENLQVGWGVSFCD